MHLVDKNNSSGLINSTVRIECTRNDGENIVGTGFFCDLEINEDGDPLTVIVTNKHVIERGIFCEIDIPVLFKDDTEGHVPLNINDNLEEVWTSHEEKNIDLCVLNIAAFITKDFIQKNKILRLNYNSIHPNLFPNKKELKTLEAIEEVIMIGYPEGIMDEVNIKPITRKGITATHPNVDYEDSPEFLIDIPSFEGSSGSPVFLYNRGSWIDHRNQIMVGDRIYFLGVLYAGFDISMNGELVKATTNKMKMNEMKIHLNIGIVIKANKVMDFKDLLKERFLS